MINFMNLFLLCFILAPIRSDDALNEYLRKTINNFKEILPNGDNDLKIPPMDPYRVNDIDTQVNDKKVQLTLKLKNMIVNGISKFELTNLDANVQDLTLKAGVVFPQLSINGFYDINGKAMRFLPIYGSGNAKIVASGFQIDASVGLKIDMESGQLGITNFDTKVNFNEASFQLENLLGGGSLGDIVNVAINMLAKPLFDKKRPEIENEIKKIVPKLLEKELKKVDIRKILTEAVSYDQPFNAFPNADNVNSYVDQLLFNLKNDASVAIDPLPVENQNTKFAGIKVEVNDGRIYGLKTVHRTGNMNLNCQPNSPKCSFTGEIGVDNVVAKFGTRLKYLFIKMSPSLEVKVNELRVTFNVALDLAASQGEVAKMVSFSISKFSDPKLNIGNLGPLGKVLTWISRIIVPLVKGKIVNAVEKPMRSALEQQLKKVKFDF